MEPSSHTGSTHPQHKAPRGVRKHASQGSGNIFSLSLFFFSSFLALLTTHIAPAPAAGALVARRSSGDAGNSPAPAGKAAQSCPAELGKRPCCCFGQFLFLWINTQPRASPQGTWRPGGTAPCRLSGLFHIFVAYASCQERTGTQPTFIALCGPYRCFKSYFTTSFYFNNSSSVALLQTAPGEQQHFLKILHEVLPHPGPAPAHPRWEPGVPDPAVSCKTRVSRESQGCPAPSRARDAAIRPAGHLSHADGCRKPVTGLTERPASTTQCLALRQLTVSAPAAASFVTADTGG